MLSSSPNNMPQNSFHVNMYVFCFLVFLSICSFNIVSVLINQLISFFYFVAMHRLSLAGVSGGPPCSLWRVGFSLRWLFIHGTPTPGTQAQELCCKGLRCSMACGSSWTRIKPRPLHWQVDSKSTVPTKAVLFYTF